MASAGRRPGEGAARGAILEAARRAFAREGYDRATIRLIAASAGVDPALIHHYFGTKEDLFAEVIRIRMRPAQVAESVLEGGLDEIGQRMVRVFLSVGEDPETREAYVAMLRSALTNEMAAVALRQFWARALLERLAAEVDLPDAELRLSLCAAHLVGIAVLRYVMGLEPLASVSVDELAEIVTPKIQAYLTDPQD